MFNIKLINKKTLEEIKVNTFIKPDYDDELDDGRSIIFDICQIFGETKEIVFVVSGFGQDLWPVDCQTDLTTVIEQLPEILRKISNNNYNFQLDFYEQGIERLITFKDYIDIVNVNCISGTSWKPIPCVENVSKENIDRIFLGLYKSFLAFGKILCFDLINHKLLKEWFGDLSSIKSLKDGGV